MNIPVPQVTSNVQVSNPKGAEVIWEAAVERMTCNHCGDSMELWTGTLLTNGYEIHKVVDALGQPAAKFMICTKAGVWVDAMLWAGMYRTVFHLESVTVYFPSAKRTVLDGEELWTIPIHGIRHNGPGGEVGGQGGEPRVIHVGQ